MKQNINDENLDLNSKLKKLQKQDNDVQEIVRKVKEWHWKNSPSSF